MILIQTFRKTSELQQNQQEIHSVTKLRVAFNMTSDLYIRLYTERTQSATYASMWLKFYF